MGFLPGNPFVHYRSVGICHLQFCAFYFASIRQGYFGKLHYGCLIFKAEHKRYGCPSHIFGRDVKLLHFPHGGEPGSRSGLFHVIRKAHRQVCRKCQLPFGIRSFFLNDGIRLQEHVSPGIGDILPCAQGEYCPRHRTVRILFCFQHLDLHLLALVLPVRGKYHHRGILVPVGQVHLPDFPI